MNTALRIIGAIAARPVTTTMVTVALVLFGIVAASRMPVELLPDLSYPSITVQTEYADAAPLEVEELVTRPVEELVGGVPGVVAVESASREGQSEVVLDFSWGTDIDVAMADVREKLDRVRLPPSSDRPIVLRYDPAQEPVMRLALTGPSSDEASLAALRDSADRLVKRPLEKLPGVAAATLHGGDEEEIRVDLDPDRLRALRVDTQEIVAAIGGDNVNRPGGGLTEGGNRYLIRTVHEARTAQELGEVIVRSQDGAHLRLRDLATVSRGPIEREESFLVGGKQAVELSVFREGDANTVSVARRVSERVEKLDLPAGQRVIVLSNQSRFIEAAINEVVQATIFGGLLAIGVLLFFLRDLRATAVIATAIPISLLAAFVPLRALGVSLNLMSLGGLALGVGMLVDNSIVALESIARVRERDSENPAADGRALETAIEGTAEIAGPVVASTLTTIAVFLPMAFVQGVAGQLVRDLALAVSFSIASSMLVSLTVVPVLQGLGPANGEVEPAKGRGVLAYLVLPFALAYRFLGAVLRGASAVAGFLTRPLTAGYDALLGTYPRVHRLALRLRVPVLVGAFALCVVSVFAARGLGRTLIPEVQQGEFNVQVIMPRGTSLEATTSLTRHLMASVEGDPRVALVFARVGSVAQSGSATGTLTGPHLAQIDLQLDAQAHANDPDLESALFERLSGAATGSDVTLRLGHPALFSFEAPIEIRVFGDESELAMAHARTLVEPLRSLGSIGDVVADDLEGRPEVRVSFDRERLGRLGLDVDAVSLAVQRAIQGEIAGQLHADDKQLDIRVRLPRVDRSNRSDVVRIPVGVSADVPVRLGAVAEVEPAVGPAEVRRIDGRRGLRIQARPTTSDLSRVAADVEAMVARLDERAPASVQSVIAGQVSEMGSSLSSLAFTTALSLFLVYVVMASSFESLHHPFLIMFTVPLAAVGVVVACFVASVPISAMVGIGGMVLGGIVVNNAIVLVNAVNARRGQGMDVTEALLDAGAARLRPILMTTATTVLGLLPMAFGFGEGAALRQPLAVAVIGGLLAATLLTLVVIPCAYALVPGRRRAAWASDAPSEP